MQFLSWNLSINNVAINSSNRTYLNVDDKLLQKGKKSQRKKYN